MIGKYEMADEFLSATQNFSSNNLPILMIFQNFEKYEKKQEGSTLPNGYKYSFHFGSADSYENYGI